MSKFAQYLQEHLDGEVLTSVNIRKFFSTDGSIFAIAPNMVVYPEHESDVRKTARFCWQLAERDRALPITARGYGTSSAGGAIGSGVVMSFPGHMNTILELDSKGGTVVAEPGVNLASLQQTLNSHGRFLPVSPAQARLSSIGGVIATGASGSTAAKYGNIGNYVKTLRVVLANGEVIETRKLSKRELNKKLGLTNFEGQVYRELDKLLEENHEIVTKLQRNVTKNTAGYNLAAVKRKDSFDLTPLLVGSEGTLGLITEATLTTKPYNNSTTMIVAFLDDLKLADVVLSELRSLPDQPSSALLIDKQLLELVYKHNPNQLKGVIDKPLPQLVLIVEFDNLSDKVQKRLVKKVQKTLRHDQINYLIASEDEDKQRFRKIERAISVLRGQLDGDVQALPFIDDGIVPADRFSEYLENVYQLCQNYNLETGIWGDIGSANLHLMPILNISSVGDRQRIFRVMDDYYKLVINLGGSTSGEYGDGRLRAPYLAEQYGDDVYNLMLKVKQIFDPYNILNPGVKLNMGIEGLKPLLRSSYSVTHLYNHLPQS